MSPDPAAAQGVPFFGGGILGAPIGPQSFRACADCGHTEGMHVIVRLRGVGLEPERGVCAAQVDMRPPATGGPDLSPCPCKGFR